MSHRPDFIRLRRLVADNQIQVIMDELLPYADSLTDPSLRDEILLFSSEWQAYKSRVRARTESIERIDLQRRQLSNHLLQLFDQLEVQAPAQSLQLQTKSNKGQEEVHFAAGEEVRLYVSVNRPCTLRLIYQLADQQYILLDKDRRISATECNHWIELGDGFTVEAPFGTEVLHVFAQEGDFPPIHTTVNTDGYELILDGLPRKLAKTTTRGLKKKIQQLHAQLTIHTHS